MEINSPEIDRDRDLTEDEFWAERRRLEAEGFELVMTYDVSTDVGRRNHESQIRSFGERGTEFRRLRKPNGAIQILKRKTANIQQTTRDNIVLSLVN